MFQYSLESKSADNVLQHIWGLLFSMFQYSLESKSADNNQQASIHPSVLLFQYSLESKSADNLLQNLDGFSATEVSVLTRVEVGR